MIKQESAFVGC